MFVLMRAVTYASLFIGLVLVFLPSRLLSLAGIVQPKFTGLPQVAGMVTAAVGAVLALWCVTSFFRVGHGTPAPFDPPRCLVVAGPYRIVRNPMYIGAGLTLAGAALFYASFGLLAYLCLLFLASHLFILFHEEPALKRRFGEEYSAYCRTVRRWVPRL
ncbi:MAG: isoprenylcysteine carboxylmethyltransferase family protein [Gemmatimonadales bacterium]|nr:isoprenylcysteine carboxylmethyltransferase family protein [Gemmatimonadales bacterium]